MDLLHRLRQATAPLHAGLETNFERSGGFGSRERLVRTLQKFFGFHEPWERTVGGHPVAADLMADRWRTDRLRADLQFLGCNPTGLPHCQALPALHNAGRVFGSLYVMEGSTLGGQVVARRVEQSLGLSEGRGYSYFFTAGPSVGSRWKDFLARMLSAAEAEPADEVIAGAVDTFRSLGDWFATDDPRDAPPSHLRPGESA